MCISNITFGTWRMIISSGIIGVVCVIVSISNARVVGVAASNSAAVVIINIMRINSKRGIRLNRTTNIGITP